jgi:hypothetical protein
MNKVKVSEATNIQLNWLVAKCEGATDLRIHIYGERSFWVYTTPKDDDFPESMQYLSNVEYSTDWSLGGPIIEREKIQSGYIATFKEWECRMRGGNRSVGPTMLVAAMRCHVVSKIGDTAEVPDDLTA